MVVKGQADATDNCTLTPNADKRNTNYPDDLYGNIRDPDLNNNGVVDPADFSVLKGRFGQTGFPDQGLNGNGIVEPADFSTLKGDFGKPPGPQ